MEFAFAKSNISVQTGFTAAQVQALRTVFEELCDYIQELEDRLEEVEEIRQL